MYGPWIADVAIANTNTNHQEVLCMVAAAFAAAATLKSNDSRFCWLLLLAMLALLPRIVAMPFVLLLSVAGAGCAPQVLQFMRLRHASCGGSLIASRRLLPFIRSPTTIMCKSSSNSKNGLTKAKNNKNKKNCKGLRAQKLDATFKYE